MTPPSTPEDADAEKPLENPTNGPPAPATEPEDPETYRQIAYNLIKRGEPFLALDVIQPALVRFPQDLRLLQLQSLALARSGEPEPAREILEKLREQVASHEKHP